MPLAIRRVPRQKEQHWPFAQGHGTDGQSPTDIKGQPRRHSENVLVAATGPVRGCLDLQRGEVLGPGLVIRNSREIDFSLMFF